MDADREARRPVVGEHPLPDGRLGQLGRLSGRTERQGELLLLTARAGNALGTRHEAELPEQPAPRQIEAVARAGHDQRLEAVLRELRPLCEVANALERPAAVALLHDRLRV